MNETQPTDAEIIALNAGEIHFSESPTKYPEAGHGTQYHAGAPGVLSFARAVLAKWGTPAPVGVEPIGVVGYTVHGTQYVNWLSNKAPAHGTPIYTSPQPTKAQAVAMPLTDREIELIDGMIQVQLDHASRCDAIANRSMADKQKGWDMERVALLQKFKAHGIKGGQHGAEH